MSDEAALLLAQSLCTRLCHDLAGPLGAIGTGAELLEEEEGTPDSQIMRLLTDSAKSAAARLRFLRALTGLPTGRGLDPDQARDLLAGHLATSGQRAPVLDWGVEAVSETDGGRPLVQLLLVLSIVGLEVLPRHEYLSITVAGARRAEVRIRGVGEPRMGPLAALMSEPGTPSDPTDPRSVLGLYAALLARTRGLTVLVETLPGVLHLCVRPEA